MTIRHSLELLGDGETTEGGVALSNKEHLDHEAAFLLGYGRP